MAAEVVAALDPPLPRRQLAHGTATWRLGRSGNVSSLTVSTARRADSICASRAASSSRSHPQQARWPEAGKASSGAALARNSDPAAARMATRRVSKNARAGAGTPESEAETGPSSRNVRFLADFFGSTPESRRGPEGPSWSLIDPQQKSRLTNS